MASLWLLANPVQGDREIHKYSVEVHAPSTKPDGKAWDVSGGAPDMILSVDGRLTYSNPNCLNRYKCTFEIFSKSDNFYLEIYDKDMLNNDIIATGYCSTDKICSLGQASVKVVRVE